MSITRTLIIATFGFVLLFQICAGSCCGCELKLLKKLGGCGLGLNKFRGCGFDKFNGCGLGPFGDFGLGGLCGCGGFDRFDRCDFDRFDNCGLNGFRGGDDFGIGFGCRSGCGFGRDLDISPIGHIPVPFGIPTAVGAGRRCCENNCCRERSVTIPNIILALLPPNHQHKSSCCGERQCCDRSFPVPPCLPSLPIECGCGCGRF